MAKSSDFEYNSELYELDLSEIDQKKAVLPKPKIKVSRSPKTFRLRDDLHKEFDKLVFDHKMAKDKTGPELADQAIELLLDYYD